MEKAKEIAREQELDLVEISPKAVPPVCKVIDYKKFLYEQKKRDKALKSKATKVTVKEIRFGPQTDEHDYEFKKKHAIKFLSEGAKLKAFVFFKGRSIIYKDQGQILLLRLAQDLEDLGKVEQITGKHGDILQLRPKAANASVKTKAFNHKGEPFLTLPRGFYLKTAFTQHLIHQHLRV